MSQETKFEIAEAITLVLILGIFVFYAHFATKDITVKPLSEPVVFDQQQVQNSMREFERLESEMRRERERRKIQTDIRSMYLPPYLAGC